MPKVGPCLWIWVLSLVATKETKDDEPIKPSISQPPIHPQALREFENNLWFANPDIFEYVNDDEFGFFEEFQLQPNYVDEVIPKFIKHERLLMFSVFLQFIAEVYFIISGYFNREETFREVGPVLVASY